MKYEVNVRGRTYQLEIGDEALSVDGRVLEAEIEATGGDGSFRLRVGPGVHIVHCRRGAAPGAWTVHAAGRSHDVEVADERSRAIKALAGPAVAQQAALLTAPMPGLVVRVNVNVGDRVTAGQGVVVIEAMKMENELRAPRDGIIEKISVTPGEAVEKGKELLSVRS